MAVFLQHSTNLTDWTTLGPEAHWNYANGKATSGDTIVANKITTADTKGLYHETGTLSEAWLSAAITEVDFAIKPVVANVQRDTKYYFRLSADDGGTYLLSAGGSYLSVYVVGNVDLTIALADGFKFADALSIQHLASRWASGSCYVYESPTYSNSCWNTAGAAWANSCWNTAGPSWANSCWNTAGPSWAKSCWNTAGPTWARNLCAVSGVDT